MTPSEAEDLGLGLAYGTVRLVRTPPEWATVAERLIGQVRTAVGSDAGTVAHIGSTAVPGLLAKPIIDIGIRLVPGARTGGIVEALESLGYEYRGDAADGGGLVFVLDVRPRVRVAHVHAIAHGDPQWEQYVSFVERLRTDPDARTAYEAVKRRLAAAHPDDRPSYTTGKDDIVEHLAPRR